jgi:hypothetical protein
MQAWIDARQRHGLSHAQVQMAQELGMNPAKLGKLDNHDQEPCKMPLREYLEHLYLKRFGRACPDAAMPIEDRWPLGYEGNTGRDGRQARPTHAIDDREFRGPCVGAIGSCRGGFTDKTRTIRR